MSRFIRAVSLPYRDAIGFRYIEWMTSNGEGGKLHSSQTSAEQRINRGMEIIEGEDNHIES